MTNLLTVLVSILVFGAVIFVHELGHFLAARHCGIRIKEFSIGMGPAIWSRTKNGTMYSLRLLPIGGYNAMDGEDGSSPDAEASTRQAEGQEAEAPALPSGANKSGSADKLWSKTVLGKRFDEATVGQRMLVIISGALMNFLLGFVLLLVLVCGQNGEITSKIIYDFTKGALCEQTGLQPEDEVIAVNGHRCFVASDIIYELQRAENYTADFTVLRDGKKVNLPGVQFGTTTQADGTVTMNLEFRVYGIAKTPRTVVREACNQFFYYARLIVRSLTDLVGGRVSVNELSGPVGIVSAIGEAVSYGWQDVFSLAALITINLGIFNLLPFPALDGGRFVFLAIEGVAKKPVPTRIQAAVNAAGMLLLLALMMFVTFHDVIRFLK